MADDTEIPIPSIIGLDEVLKPSDRPVMGTQRLVRFLPVMGTGLYPAIWISPYTVKEPIETDGPLVSVAKCVVLVSKGPPRPEIVVLTMRPEDIEKFPRAPVEW
jgi:hypothetical protein